MDPRKKIEQHYAIQERLLARRLDKYYRAKDEDWFLNFPLASIAGGAISSIVAVAIPPIFHLIAPLFFTAAVGIVISYEAKQGNFFASDIVNFFSSRLRKPSSFENYRNQIEIYRMHREEAEATPDEYKPAHWELWKAAIELDDNKNDDLARLDRIQQQNFPDNHSGSGAIKKILKQGPKKQHDNTHNNSMHR